MTSQKFNEEHEILRRFMAVVVSSAFRDSLIPLPIPFLGLPLLVLSPRLQCGQLSLGAGGTKRRGA